MLIINKIVNCFDYLMKKVRNLGYNINPFIRIPYFNKYEIFRIPLLTHLNIKNMYY